MAPEFGFGVGDVERAIRWAVRTRYWIGSAPLRRLIPRVRRAAMSGLPTHVLMDLYGEKHPFLRCRNEHYPVVSFHPPGGPRRIALDDHTLGGALQLDRTPMPALGASRRDYYWLQRSQVGGENRPTFVMRRLRPNAPMSLTCGISDFYSTVKTSNALEWELYEQVGRSIDKKSPDIAAIKRRLRFRDVLTKGLDDPLLDGHGRSASIGMSVMLAYEQDGETKVLLRRRGRHSMVYDVGKWHVYPSCVVQCPQLKDIEFSPIHVLLWEYFEEFFDRKDPELHNQAPTWFYSAEPVAELRRMIASEAAELWFTGIAVNPASLRPEILLLLYVRDDRWARLRQDGNGGEGHWTFSLEAVAKDYRSDNTSSSAEAVCRPRDNPTGCLSPDDFFERYKLFQNEIVPVGAACLDAGLRTLQKRIG